MGKRWASLGLLVTLGVLALTFAAIPAAQGYPIPKVCKVPNVVGKRLPAAEAKVVKANCSIGTITTTASSTVKKGRVISTSPPAGSTGARGAAVNFTVSLGAPKHGAKCKVPRLKGRDLRAATARLIHANCGVGKITKQKSKTVAKNHVISSSPGAGTIAAVGTKVDLVVSSGKKHSHHKHKHHKHK